MQGPAGIISVQSGTSNGTISLSNGVGVTTLMNAGIAAGKYMTVADFALSAPETNTLKTEFFCALTLGSDQVIAGGRVVLSPGHKTIMPVTYAFNSPILGRIIAECTVLAPSGNTGTASVHVSVLPVGTISALLP